MTTKTKETNLATIHQEVNKELANKEVLNSLVETTFKKFTPELVKKAIVEGMIRGFNFKDFLEKNVYAIPYGDSYSLVTSIDYARKIGMRSGVIGKSAPTYEMDGDKIVSCTVTIKKLVNRKVGEFTETVYFNEYYKKPKVYNGKEIPSLWDTKPKTMIAKVAEMHSLRMACPEELSQAYVEEEVGKETTESINILDNIISECEKKIRAAKTLKDLADAWGNCPVEVKVKLESVKNELKAALTPKENENN